MFAFEKILDFRIYFEISRLGTPDLASQTMTNYFQMRSSFRRLAGLMAA